MECSDERYEMFNNSCYLFVSYPKVTWETASQVCKGMKAELASVKNSEEESFITGNIRNSIEYTTSSVYWLGGYQVPSNGWKWVDGDTMDYTAWPPLEETESFMKGDENYCLAVQWVSLKTESSHSSSGLYWTPQGCMETGGYVCKKGNQVTSETVNLNKSVNGTEGQVMSPGYPAHYYNNLDYHVHIVGPIWTRIVIAFSKIDLESQAECLYDFIELKSGGMEQAQVRWCGNKTGKKTRSVFVSDNNEAILRFHSDYSVTGNGFYANWKAVDISGCPSQKLTAREGIISSPNYGDFPLPQLDCTTIIIAPPGKRIWLEFEEIDLTDETRQKDTRLELDLGGNHNSFQLHHSEDIGKGNFLSFGEKMVVRLKTSQDPKGAGFRAVYRTVSALQEEKILNLSPDSSGALHHLNFPAHPPANVSFVQHLIAPIGYVIYLDLHQVQLSDFDKTCSGDSGIIEVTDNYADENGTWWFLCEMKNDPSVVIPSLAITSYLNTLHIRQKSISVGTRMNATVKVKPDPNFKSKLLKASEGGYVESCRPNPCQNGGKCVNSNGKKVCQCIGHFTGMFCALTQCELEPCVFGQCELTGSAYKCHCQTGYTGLTCERKQSPCEDNPCEGRGECMEKSDSFHCRCHAWWEGPRCERRMMHIPFKPLSERMLHEPFWLGLITVFVVLGVIGLVWCAKRHFPEKLEKLLAEEADRNNRSNVSGLIRPPSVREPNPASGAVPVANSSGTGNVPRKLFGRLGIRKSSLLSLTSPQRPDRATSRTFSLDDLLRPTPRRTPSPMKKSSGSAPPKRNAAEKKQILQHLICPSVIQTAVEKDTLNEPILLKDTKRKSLPTEKTEWQETSFTSPAPKVYSKSDFGKLEKKVTFARLLNKVSAEMSSSPEPDTSSVVVVKALSTPVSPAIERKFVQNISTHHGSDSLSSSEIAISGSAFNSLLDIPSTVKKPIRVPCKSFKAPSPDTVLDMFRNFASTSVTSRGQSPSTTPTASSPQDELMGSEESSMIDTPISTTSGPLDSPSEVLLHGTTIEIPVMNALTAQKTSSFGVNSHHPPSILLEIPSSGTNKFLSPIREMPTPMASPMLTPIMPRVDMNAVKLSSSESSDDEGKKKSCREDDESEDFSEVLIQVHRENEEDEDCDVLSHTDDEFCHPNFLFPHDDIPPTADRPAMIIPLLTVQEPSPPSTSPPGSFPGSPPPQKDIQSFIYSPVGSPRWMTKGPDKPNSLDLPYPPPMITITCNVSEPESDTEFLSPAPKKQSLTSHNPTVNNVGMTYLSPFSMCSRGDRTASESNLSSSGYSSMASPGPSRCGSNNPLCLSEVEDQQSRGQSPTRYPSPHLRTPNNDSSQSDVNKHRGRSDSETLSDDPLLESNDEGIGTDHVDEKTEDKEQKNLDVFLGKDSTGQNIVDFGSFTAPSSSPRTTLKKWDNLDYMTTMGPMIPKASLQLPTIVVQSDYSEKLLSPVSSRSESPLSDKALGLGRFSPMFYSKSKCDQLPFTDSDGLYDFPSSDCPPSNNKSVQAGTTSHRKSTGRRRERRNGHRMNTSGSKTSSPTKGQNSLLEVPQKDAPGHRTIAQRKPSPKRRVKTQQPLSSSSSTESLTSRKSVSVNLLDSDGRWKKTECLKLEESNENSTEDTAEESCRPKNGATNEEQQMKRNVGFRTIGHQIRFLRRIELSLKRKRKLMACVDSEDEEDVEDPSLSLLPQRDLKKSNSIGILQQSIIPKRRMKKRNFSGLSPSLRPGQKQDVLSAVTHGQTD
ncbi:hypothetical protein RUM43_013581 [Polyplax serrata]|uniref:Uncharacterized protein n=1 Tax=Polyplax serrata TaxID=468196 RepID=A0AAN8PHS7_POLSC